MTHHYAYLYGKQMSLLYPIQYYHLMLNVVLAGSKFR